MSLVEKLTSIKTRVDNLENAIDNSGVLDNIDGTVTDKVNLLIEKAQSGGGEVIDYPEYGFTRPSWWLPRPEDLSGSPMWFLCEVPEDMESCDGYDLTDAVKVKNGRKQKWINGDIRDRSKIKINGYCVEWILNNPEGSYSLGYNYQEKMWRNLKIVTGTTLSPCSTGAGYTDGFRYAANLKVIDCPVKVPADVSGYGGFIAEGGMYCNTSAEYAPQMTVTGDGLFRGGHHMFTNATCLRKAEKIEHWGNMTYTFQGCLNLEEVSFSADCTGFGTGTFNGCINLKHLTVDKGFSASLYIHYSTQFTAEVLHAIIENYADMTGQTAPTFQVGATNLAKIDDEHKAMLEAKNINYL